MEIQRYISAEDDKRSNYGGQSSGTQVHTYLRVTYCQPIMGLNLLFVCAVN